MAMKEPTIGDPTKWPPLKFTEDELSYKTLEVNCNQKLDIIKVANQHQELLTQQGFLKIKLTDFVPLDNSLNEILTAKNADKLYGRTLQISKYFVWKKFETIPIYELNAIRLKSKLRLQHYVDQGGPNTSTSTRSMQNEASSVRPINGVQLLEQYFNTLRTTRSNVNSWTSFYAHAYGGFEFGEEGITGFDMNNLNTPIQRVFGSYEGFSDGVIMYLGITNSVFPNHNDDFGTNAFNLNYGGGSKTWLIAQKDFKPAVDRIVENAYPYEDPICKTKSCRSGHHNYVIDPQVYRDNDISFKVVEQFPGEILITGTAVYHQGINLAERNKVVVSAATNIVLNEYINLFESIRNNINQCGFRARQIIIDLEKISQNIKEEKNLLASGENITDPDPYGMNRFSERTRFPKSKAGAKDTVKKLEGLKTVAKLKSKSVIKRDKDIPKGNAGSRSERRKRREMVTGVSTRSESPAPALNHEDSSSNHVVRNLEQVGCNQISTESEVAKLTRLLEEQRKINENLKAKIQGLKGQVVQANAIIATPIQTLNASQSSSQNSPAALEKQQSRNKKSSAQKHRGSIKIRAQTLQGAKKLRRKSKKCPYCKKTFPFHCVLKQHFNQHIKSERNQVTCPKCPKMFANKPSQARHFSIVHMKKRHKCEKCTKDYSRKDSLNRHMLMAHRVDEATTEELGMEDS